jgi:cbb3-type cytochrome c oxidase subunit III|tara:strand:- start:9263 stop:9877 length:615 start_codon:yes stop_codon:yes gene_type:complete
MLVKVISLLTLLFGISLSVVAKETATPEGFEYCTVCHGSQLMGNKNIGAPRLNGLSPWYITRQLKNFKQGIRGSHPKDVTGGEMMSMVSNLSDQKLKEVVAWITTTHSDKPSSSLIADEKAGKKLYQSCVTCHGSNAHGNKTLGAPKLNDLNDWYIFTQLNHFRLGIRGAEASDSYGKQMKAASSVITSEQDAANLAVYINQLD